MEPQITIIPRTQFKKALDGGNALWFSVLECNRGFLFLQADSISSLIYRHFRYVFLYSELSIEVCSVDPLASFFDDQIVLPTSGRSIGVEISL